MHSHIHALDRSILKTDNNRCSVCADASAFAYEEICPRLYPRYITIAKDKVSGTDCIIKNCRHSFVLHCKDALQMGTFWYHKIYVVIIITGIVMTKTDREKFGFSYVFSVDRVFTTQLISYQLQSFYLEL